MANQTPILTVTQLNRHVRSLLEHEMNDVSVEGEVSNLSKPSSGHLYFSLKDAISQLRCVYFRNRHTCELVSLQNGQHILVKGKLSLYEARGDFQLIVDELWETGQGDLHQQFERLKTKLAALGLFESTRKRTIQRFPQVIGIITSPHGAALQDIRTTLARRFPVANVIVYASEVQGKQASKQLIAALHQANHEKRCDVLILARGGGSMEDLWAFNDEYLAYAIASSHIPVVAGVGHEIDFTIADFVADLRAPTPTAAAEAVTPDKKDLLALLSMLEIRMSAAIKRYVRHKQMLLEHALQIITSPDQMIRSYWQTLDYLQNQLHHVLRSLLTQKYHRLHLATTRLKAINPTLLLQQARKQLHHLQHRLNYQITIIMNQHKRRLITFMATLQAVSPLATLERGYAIVTYRHKIVFDAQAIHEGDVVSIQLAKGKLKGKIIDKGE
ncbi:exodeoxyribonuclease VII large subunit [Legionella nagasakiensis]|uniref:exodeoxyribonuclease VII large subunit n=1 Tax=Legionella nagasakiensis TaxID=535290 RepID=UPI00105415E6|nr:exodeoxyribonuclease VII large subunit [Legionella nagasakiensis]